MYETRLETIRQIARAASLNAIAIVPGANMTYLTGKTFHTSERPTVGFFFPEGDPAFILPALEKDKFATPPYAMRLFTYSDETGPAPAFAEAVEALRLDGRVVGVEGLRMRYAETRLLVDNASGIVLTDAGDVLVALRAHKGPEEIAAMRRAIQISEDALRDVIAGTKAGMTERTIAGDLLIALLKHGGSGVAFEPIVLTGPNSPLPHGSPGDRALQEGDLLLIDYGTSYAGYLSDITRTFVCGELRDQRLIDAYAAVQAANAAGRKAAGPGVPALRGLRSSGLALVTTSATAPGTAWAWTSTRTPTSARVTPSPSRSATCSR
jgi:Xaa-Pro dipeptidase